MSGFTPLILIHHRYATLWQPKQTNPLSYFCELVLDHCGTLNVLWLQNGAETNDSQSSLELNYFKGHSCEQTDNIENTVLIIPLIVLLYLNQHTFWYVQADPLSFLNLSLKVREGILD